jgi:hypothetical protein
VARKKAPKCLVIDTDVARAPGGGTSQSIISRSCREFLSTLLEETEHKVVLTRDIQAEWNKHQSRATLVWRRTMIAQKRVCLIEVSSDEVLRQQIEQHAPTETKRQAMLKDVHLLEAACQADKAVVSMDEVVRGCFRELAHQVHQLKPIAWVNPCQEIETPLVWLREGAECEKERCLGFSQKDL